MSTYGVPVRTWHGHAVKPMTHLGTWAVALAVVSGVGWLIAVPAIVFADTGVWWPGGLLAIVGPRPRIPVRNCRLDRCVSGNGRAR